MLSVVKEKKGDVLLVRLSGIIDEKANLNKLLGPAPNELHINCKGITQVTSVGVKAWIRYFQSAHTKGTKLRFIECSSAIIDQFNVISNFACGGEVESVYVPFLCQNCKSELVGLFKTEVVKKMQFRFPDLKCSKCGGSAVFDDIPEEYFGFLRK